MSDGGLIDDLSREIRLSMAADNIQMPEDNANEDGQE
jgi:hypothetical protein